MVYVKIKYQKLNKRIEIQKIFVKTDHYQLLVLIQMV
jgi:hypothetical protein